MLATKRVVDVACGSLHCLVCTEDGKVYAWGDNDEGQIGNDSTSACQVAHVSLFSSSFIKKDATHSPSYIQVHCMDLFRQKFKT